MARALRSVMLLLTIALVSACTTVDLNDPTAQAGQESPEAILNQKISALLQEQRKVCMDPKYAAVRSKSPCQSSNITFASLADNNKITATQRAQLIEASTQMDRYSHEITSLYRAFGTEPALRIADARDWAYKQSLQNRLNLANGKITWGQYLDQRMKIESEMMRRAQ